MFEVDDFFDDDLDVESLKDLDASVNEILSKSTVAQQTSPESQGNSTNVRTPSLSPTFAKTNRESSTSSNLNTPKPLRHQSSDKENYYSSNASNDAVPGPSTSILGFQPRFSLPENQSTSNFPIRKSMDSPLPTHRSTERVVRQRKFPGPAGLLPPRSHKKSSVLSEGFLVDDSGSSDKLTEKEVLSQISGSMFETSDSWLAFMEDLGSFSLVESLNLAVLPKVFKRNVRSCKVPFLAAMVTNVDASLQDPFLQLKDTFLKGEMPAILHRDVWESSSSEIFPGSVLVLKNVGVISTGTSNRKFILNITENNITAIYYSKPEHDRVQSKIICPLPTSEECFQILQNWKSTIENLPITPNKPPGVRLPPNRPLFNQCNPTGPPPKKICNRKLDQEKPKAFEIESSSFFEGLDANEFFCDF